MNRKIAFLSWLLSGAVFFDAHGARVERPLNVDEDSDSSGSSSPASAAAASASEPAAPLPPSPSLEGSFEEQMLRLNADLPATLDLTDPDLLICYQTINHMLHTEAPPSEALESLPPERFEAIRYALIEQIFQRYMLRCLPLRRFVDLQGVEDLVHAAEEHAPAMLHNDERSIWRIKRILDNDVQLKRGEYYAVANQENS